LAGLFFTHEGYPVRWALSLLAALSICRTKAQDLPIDLSEMLRPEMSASPAIPYRRETPSKNTKRSNNEKTKRLRRAQALKRQKEELKKQRAREEAIRKQLEAEAQRRQTGEGIPIISDQFLDNTHSLLSDNIIGLANRMDSFFGDQRADDELNRSGLRLSYGQKIMTKNKSDEDVVVRFNLRLPKLEEKFKIDFKRSRKKDKIVDDKLKEIIAEAKAAGRPLSEKEIAEEKVRLQTLEYEPWRFRTDVGVTASIPPRAFVRARLRKNWQLLKFIPRFVEELGYFTDEGLIERTNLDVDRTIKKGRVLLRFENGKEWIISDKRLVTAHGPVLLYNTTDNDAYAYSAKVFSEFYERGPYYLSNYQLAINYRRNLRGHWLYGDVIPAIDFPKFESFSSVYSVTLRIEALFGRR
jgi:hypothetical protein